MKDVRGAHVSSVKSATFKHFKLQSMSSRRKDLIDVTEWKKSDEVLDSYRKLYSDAAALETIVDIAFPSATAANEEAYSDMYIYTAAVCDIILNPNYPTIEVSRKPLELRFKKFKVFIEFKLLLNLICYLKFEFIQNLINNLEPTR